MGPQVVDPEVPGCGVVVECDVRTLDPDVEVGSLVVGLAVPVCGV